MDFGAILWGGVRGGGLKVGGMMLCWGGGDKG